MEVDGSGASACHDFTVSLHDKARTKDVCTAMALTLGGDGLKAFLASELVAQGRVSIVAQMATPAKVMGSSKSDFDILALFIGDPIQFRNCWKQERACDLSTERTSGRKDCPKLAAADLRANLADLSRAKTVF